MKNLLKLKIPRHFRRLKDRRKRLKPPKMTVDEVLEIRPGKGVTMERHHKGADPDHLLKSMTLYDLIRVWDERQNIYREKGKSDLFEALAHIIFSHPDERFFAYLMIWVDRDRYSPTEIAGFTGVYPPTVGRYIAYMRRRIKRYISRLSLKPVPDRGEVLSEEEELEQIAREAASGK